MTCYDPATYQPEAAPEEKPVTEELASGEFGPGFVEVDNLGIHDERVFVYVGEVSCPCGCDAVHPSRCWRDGL